jgi:serine/threonine protein kinase
MAPEMLFKGGYDYRVDIWALGVLLYEMLHGVAPFKGKSAEDVQEAMLAGNYDFASHLSEQVKALIGQILQFQPEKRASIEEISRHPWMTEMAAHVNSYLDEEGAVGPREMQAKIAIIPPLGPSVKQQPPAVTPKHRKNNSLNFEEGRNISINLEINNYAFVGKNPQLPHPHPRGKNTYHSQEKEKEWERREADEAECHKTSIKKSKMEPACKTQISEMDVYRVLEKAKSSKNVRQKDASVKRDPDSKKKLKLRKSEMEVSDKMPVRFNTEAFDKDEWL